MRRHRGKTVNLNIKMAKAILKTNFHFDGQKSLYEGKVRDVYNIDDRYLAMVVSDRISAFDVVLPKGIPFKGQVLDNWEALKRRQRGITTHAQAMEDVSTGLSPLLRASKVQNKARKVGFDFAGAAEALGKVYEEADEVAQNLHDGADPEMELGDLLFSVVNVCRLAGKNPDIALFASTNKFISRFRAMENAIKKSGKCLEDLTLSEMDVYWNTGKRGGQRV